LIRPLVYVTEDLTRAYARSLEAPVIPCGCSQKTGTVRRSIRDIFAEIEKGYPFLKENLLAAMGNLETSRLLDTRFLELDEVSDESAFFTDEQQLVTLMSGDIKGGLI
jgi:tRNA 2-thiocytidine biosynthesis protein TtcA